MTMYKNKNPYACPKCGSEQQKAIDSRTGNRGRRRRRLCKNCGYRYTTYEITEEDYKIYERSRYVSEKYTKLLRLMAIDLDDTYAAGGEDV